jgi:predicted ATP-dependent serine protease
MSGAELAASTEETVEWIMPGYVARGAISEIGAKVKAGKTTLIAALVCAAADGTDFLGFPTVKTSTVYLTEQPAVSFRQTLARAGLLGRSDFHLLLRSDVPKMSWPDVVGGAVEECKRVGAKLLVIDTLPQFAGLPGDSENNSGDALAAMQPLQQAAALGIAIVWVRHDRKAGGEVGDSGRGSSAFGGVSDILISLRSPEGNANKNIRILKAKSRFSETPSELVIELTENGFVSLGDSQHGALKNAKELIVAAVPASEGEALTVKQLAKTVGIARTTLQRGLEELVDEGKLGRVGTGNRASAFRYFLPKNDFCPTSSIRGQKENTNKLDLGTEPK